jgi:hypothetical protein
MKKVFTVFIVAALIAPMFTGCYFKKGEEDPTMSLKSRKARACGKWTLIEWTQTSTSTSTGGSSTSSLSFSGSSLVETYASGSYTAIYSESMEILKDGTYEYSSNMSSEGYSVIESGSGTWSFVTADKDNGIANKERIILTNTQYTETETYSGSSDTEVYTASGDPSSVAIQRIDKLSSKELIISRDYTKNSDGDLYTITETKVYEKE